MVIFSSTIPETVIFVTEMLLNISGWSICYWKQTSQLSGFNCVPHNFKRFRRDAKESPYKMVWRPFIASCYKKLIDLLTRLLTFYTYNLLFNILYTPFSFQNTSKTTKRQKCNLAHQNLSRMLLGAIWESAKPLCMD